MLEQIEALRALRATGTTGAAAARLRVTQSAVSKRIAALERQVGASLVERVGRRLRLSPEGERVLAEAEPLLVRLQEVLAGRGATPGALALGASESLLSSWLPATLKATGLPLELHAHRGPLLLERVRAGELAVAVCAGGDVDPELRAEHVGDEPMVLVGEGSEVWSIEERSLTWQAVAMRARKRGLRVTRRLESFTALVQVARAGFGVALVPAGLAPEGRPAGFARPIHVVARPTTFDRAGVADLVAALRTALGGRA
ncbi:MAG: LysR family transcriptional regulator [Myxococcota bacterium]